MNNNTSDDILTIYEVADVLGLHHKTIRGFISDGKLKGIKVGKQWRITREDLNIFMGKGSAHENELNDESPQIDVKNREVTFSNNDGNDNPIKNRISISAVVDMKAVNQYKFERISNTLLAVMNSKDIKLQNATIHIKYDQDAKVCKVFLWGSVEYINEMLSIVSLLDKEDSDEI